LKVWIPGPTAFKKNVVLKIWVLLENKSKHLKEVT